MTGKSALIVKPAGEKAIAHRHHWLFSGAIQSLPDAENGTVVPVLSRTGDLLGHAYFNRNCSLLARMVSFGAEPPMDAIRRRLASAIALRKDLLGSRTDACRVVHGEADGIPGLILDRYGDLLVFQVGTLGIELLREEIVAMTQELLAPSGVFERSDTPSRKIEGLAARTGWLSGEAADRVEFHEDTLKFCLYPEKTQKTGFFLDQRDARALVARLAPGRRVLDCFCYTGGFSVSALAAGAASAHLVDSSARALEVASEHLRMNGLDGATLVEADAFAYLREQSLDFDLLILDPPAFARRKADVTAACRGYKEINRLALAKAPRGALVMTFSCSLHVDAKLFGQVVFQAACEAGREVRILRRLQQAVDHPTNIFHPETEYLKGLLLQVT